MHDRLLLNLPHVQQRHSWDCGLACILMTLPPHARHRFESNFYEICEEEGFGESTWSIDIAYLLHKLGMRHRYVTVTLGIDPGFSSESFYDHVLGKDAHRVTERFKQASKHGIVVEQGSISISQIVAHVRSQGPVIVLTNAHLLVCDRCAKAMPQLRSCLPCAPPYQGHYIVVIGYDMNKGTLYYRNPSYKDRICSISLCAFDNARLSYGTDEDIIFLYSDVGRG
ncbi:protein GUCD1 [Oratosquilla oratoria]|uniref:protein GUCD1 n=1 Tax=Oratosquilla oratoria TaxID=337810 RepID=UPI003F763200